jgi:hypothetical protein
MDDTSSTPPPTLADLVARGEPGQALRALTDALTYAAGRADERIALLELRVGLLVRLGQLARAEGDAQAMLTLAARAHRGAYRVRALCALSLVQQQRGQPEAAFRSASEAASCAARMREGDERNRWITLAAQRRVAAAQRISAAAPQAGAAGPPLPVG